VWRAPGAGARSARGRGAARPGGARRTGGPRPGRRSRRRSSTGAPGPGTRRRAAAPKGRRVGRAPPARRPGRWSPPGRSPRWSAGSAPAGEPPAGHGQASPHLLVCGHGPRSGVEITLMTAVWRRSNCRCKLGRLLQAAVVADDPAGSVLRGRRMCASRSRRWHGRSPESERRSRPRGRSPPLPGHPRCGSPGARRPARSLLRAASTTAITRRPDSQQAGKVSTPPADVGHRQVHATGAGRQRGQPSSRSHAGTQGFHQSLPETRPTHARRQALPGVRCRRRTGRPRSSRWRCGTTV
jgi:hypothetical protein